MRVGFDRRAGIAVLALLAASSWMPMARADQVVADDLIVNGSLCVGVACANGEAFGAGTMRLKTTVVRLDMIDTSSAGVARRDWRIEANAASGSAEYFAIKDMGSSATGGEGGNAILQLTGGARANSIFVGNLGRVGLGTATPNDEFHVVTGDTATIKLEQDGSNGLVPRAWRMSANDTGFRLDDGDAVPFFIRAGAPEFLIFVSPTGRVSVGGGNTDASLDVRSTPASIGAGNAVLKLVNPAGPTALQMQPFGTGFFWNFAASDNDTFNVNRSGNSAVEMSLNGAGNLTISGTLTTGGPTCATGCDAVFDPAYALPSIEEHAEAMWEKKHLPNVGPTLPHQPVNLSEQYGRVLNELETAHIYIEQLHRRIEGQDAGIAQLRTELDLLKKSTGDLAGN
jgi:hypothetical protein